MRGMIIPNRHIAPPWSISRRVDDLFEPLLRARFLFDRGGAHGYKVGCNVGELAGQTVPNVHLRVIGRFADEDRARHTPPPPASGELTTCEAVVGNAAFGGFRQSSQ